MKNGMIQDIDKISETRNFNLSQFWMMIAGHVALDIRGQESRQGHIALEIGEQGGSGREFIKVQL